MKLWDHVLRFKEWNTQQRLLNLEVMSIDEYCSKCDINGVDKEHFKLVII